MSTAPEARIFLRVLAERRQHFRLGGGRSSRQYVSRNFMVFPLRLDGLQHLELDLELPGLALLDRLRPSPTSLLPTQEYRPACVQQGRRSPKSRQTANRRIDTPAKKIRHRLEVSENT
jgi:hypothetical protein